METKINKSKLFLRKSASLIIELIKYQTMYQKGITLNQLAQLANIDRPYVTKKTQQLVELGWAEQNFINLNYSEVSLTKKGGEIATLIKKIYEVLEG